MASAMARWRCSLVVSHVAQPNLNMIDKLKQQGNFLFVNEQQLRAIIGDEVRQALDAVKNTPKRMYTRKEVCDILHITLGTLRNMVNNGQFASARRQIGKRRALFDADMVDELVNNGIVRKGKHMMKGGRA